MVKRLLIGSVVALLGMDIGGYVGTIYAGNYAQNFVFLGLRGYEAGMSLGGLAGLAAGGLIGAFFVVPARTVVGVAAGGLIGAFFVVPARTVVGGILGGIAGALVGSVVGFFSLFCFMDGLIIAGQRVDPAAQIVGVAIVGTVPRGIAGASKCAPAGKTEAGPFWR
jgi:hypothetical protein